MAPDSRSRGGPPGGMYDPAAFEVFYRRHVDAVTRFMARRVADPHTVADLTAETFLAVIDSARAYRPDLGSETAWLYGIARNVVAAEARRSARQSALGGRVAGRRLLEADDIGRSWRTSSTPRRPGGGRWPRWTGSPRASARSSNSSPSTS